jgi:hypothetical protein
MKAAIVKLVLIVAVFLFTSTLILSIKKPANAIATPPDPQIFLPLVERHRAGIYGRVTAYNNAISEPLLLRFFNGVTWSTMATTASGSDGYYAFLNIPSLGPGQEYYVLFQNSGNQYFTALWVWGTRLLTSYTAGASVEIGNFDIADIPLVSPLNITVIALPFPFRWTPRPNTPSDSYELDLFDPSDGNPYFYTNPSLGYVGSYNLVSLPQGFTPNVQYGWEVVVYSPDGGYGISYDTSLVTFLNAGLRSPTMLAPSSRNHARLLIDNPHR